jgi:hypothetical protein
MRQSCHQVAVVYFVALRPPAMSPVAITQVRQTSPSLDEIMIRRSLLEGSDQRD